MRSTLFAGVVVAASAACGGSSTSASSTSPPSNRAAAISDATEMSSCYPYARQGGACLTKCDWSSPHGEQGCAKGDWPLLCNRDGTCTPEVRFDP